MHRERREYLLVRLVFMALFVVFFKLSFLLALTIALIQWFVLWFQQQPVSSMARFSRSLGRYQRAILDYLSFQSEEKVFPFRDWPTESDSCDSI